MDWRERFRVPAVIYAELARDDPDRGVVITDLDEKYQAYAWDRAAGTVDQVTASETGVITAAISPKGDFIYTLVDDDPGTEIGHIHRFPFQGGESEDVTPDLGGYTAYYLEATERGVVALAGLGGKQVLLVVEGEESRTIELPTLPIGLVVADSEDRAAVTLVTPGRGQVPRLRVIDLASGDILSERAETEAGAMHGDIVAVAEVRGDWLRPGLWDGSRFTTLEVEIPGDVAPVDWSNDGGVILLSQSHRAKTALYLYHLASAEVTPLASPPGATYPRSSASLVDRDTALSIWSDANNPWRVFELTTDEWRVVLQLEEQHTFPGPQWEEFIFPSTGGVEIQGWLLRPEGEGPWPTLLYTHGGPTSVAGPTFNAIAGAWLDNGFAVASINYRGSTTFGESFREALTANIGGPDIDDVVAARHWLVDNGIADPDRIVKNGYSYGGFLTLQSLGTHPDLWAAGVAGAPIADWALNYEDSNDILRAYDHSLFGAPPEELPDIYRKASPRTYAADFKAPVMISQPEKDSRTPLRQVEVFVDEMQALGKDVRFEILKGGHPGAGKEQWIGMVESWLDFARPIVGLDRTGS